MSMMPRCLSSPEPREGQLPWPGRAWRGAVATLVLLSRMRTVVSRYPAKMTAVSRLVLTTSHAQSVLGRCPVLSGSPLNTMLVTPITLMSTQRHSLVRLLFTNIMLTINTADIIIMVIRRVGRMLTATAKSLMIRYELDNWEYIHMSNIESARYIYRLTKWGPNKVIT